MKKLIGSLFLKIFGWKLDEDSLERSDKMVMVAAPHTTNWDFPITMAIFLKMGIKIRFVAKKSLFKFPMGILIRGFGGIPVDRSKSTNFVDSAAELIDSFPKILLLVAVEGTRSSSKGWKSGFYHIANTAKVPIGLGYLDYKNKQAGFFPTFTPSGDYEADLSIIQAFYEGL